MVKKIAEKYTPKRKLATADIIGQDIKKWWKQYNRDHKLDDGEQVELYTIGGIVTKYDMVPTAFGEATRLIGQFTAKNSLTQQLFKSNRAFLPTICAESILGLIGTQKAGEKTKFAFKIFIQDDDKSSTGYIYAYESLIAETQSNEMLELESLMGMDTETGEIKEPAEQPA